MSGASTLHTQLLHQAELLATKEPKKPRQASLRRSISTSYYAAFHFLIYQATRKIVGTSHDRKPLRELLGRAFNHGEMLDICKSFRSGTGGLPATVERAFKPLTIPQELQQIADNFVTLQNERHQADYDLSAKFRRRDALEAHALADECIKLWPKISSHSATDFFLVGLSTWKRIKRR